MSSFITAGILGIIILAIIRKLIKDKANGKKGCGGNCEGCSGCKTNSSCKSI